MREGRKLSGLFVVALLASMVVWPTATAMGQAGSFFVDQPTEYCIETRTSPPKWA